MTTTWVCYARTDRGRITTRRVRNCDSAEHARALYDTYGYYTFLTAEPIEDAAQAGLYDSEGHFMGTDELLKSRVALLMGDVHTSPPATLLPNKKSRLLPVDEFVAQLNEQDPQELARRAWEATQASAKSGGWM